MGKQLKRRLALVAAQILGYPILRLLWASYRVRVDEESVERFEALTDPKTREPVIFAFWHDHTFLSTAFLVKNIIDRGVPVSVMISPSDDGEFGSRALQPLGVTLVRGSASRGGSRALRALCRSVMRENTSAVMVPDGPKGPQFVAKPGTVALAQLTQRRILPLALTVDRAWTLNSWDSMAMPKPFAKINVFSGEPIAVARRLTEDELRAETESLGDALDRVRQRANSVRPRPTKGT